MFSTKACVTRIPQSMTCGFWIHAILCTSITVLQITLTYDMFIHLRLRFFRIVKCLVYWYLPFDAMNICIFTFIWIAFFNVYKSIQIVSGKKLTQLNAESRITIQTLDKKLKLKLRPKLISRESKKVKFLSFRVFDKINICMSFFAICCKSIDKCLGKTCSNLKITLEKLLKGKNTCWWGTVNEGKWMIQLKMIAMGRTPLICILYV